MWRIFPRPIIGDFGTKQIDLDTSSLLYPGGSNAALELAPIRPAQPQRQVGRGEPSLFRGWGSSFNDAPVVGQDRPERRGIGRKLSGNARAMIRLGPLFCR